MRIPKLSIILGLLLSLYLTSASYSTISSSKPAQKPVRTLQRTVPYLVAAPVTNTTQTVPVAATSAPAVTTPTPQAAPVSPALSDHESLMQAAGIAPSDWDAVDYIVSHESGWNQAATEPVTGAHGLVQALPFSKTGCGWDDAVCTLAWGDSYAKARYGGWWPAQAYWQANRSW